MANYIATRKVWRTHKNELVEDGHEDAAQLVAPRGGAVDEARLRRYEGFEDFFAEEGSDEADKARREDKTPARPWTHEEIQAYRNSREDGNARTATATPAPAKASARPAPAEKLRKSRPGPDKAGKKASKKAAAE